MTTGGRPGENGTARTKKPARKRAAAPLPTSRTEKESDMTMTMNSPAATATATGTASDKDFFDFLGGVLPNVAQHVAPTFGIDPRVAGQTVSQVMSMFGIGGPGKAFAPAVPRDQAVAQLKEVVAPHLADPAFAKALGLWMQAAVQPVQAQQQGKAYQPDLDKSWLSDAFDSVTGAIDDVVSGVDWGQVAQVGMRALPYVIAAL
jgi:hypothetical protein